VVVNSQAVTTQRDGVGPSPEPTELKFVGPATAAVIEDASFDAAGIRDRTVSFGMLDAGVNPGVAARIRREHSLPWSFDTEADRSDLTRRSDQVRGLNDGERDWVAASTGDWAENDPGEPNTEGVDAESGASAADATDTEGRANASGGATGESQSEASGAATADSIDPRPAGEWPETARPDDTDDEPAETTAWPETARPETARDDADDEPADGDTAITDSDTAITDSDTAAGDTAGGAGPWPVTARPDGFATDKEADATDEEADATAATADPTGDQQATADGSGDPVQAETAWRERSAPVPVTELDGVDDETRETLAAAGITSVRSLATADPAAVAAALDLSEDRLVTLRETARSSPD